MSALATLEPDAREVVAAIADEELARLLGLPRHRPFEGAIVERAQGARRWYAAHGRPRIVARRSGIASLESGAVRFDNEIELADPAPAERLRVGRAHAALAVAITAGSEVDVECERLWATDLPDEAFFLDRVATAAVERLVRIAAVELCRRGSLVGETALPHLSPGCGAWPIDGQFALWRWLTNHGTEPLAPFELLESGMTKPKLSLLALIGLTPDRDAPQVADARASCRACDLAPCSFRRAPFGSAA